MTRRIKSLQLRLTLELAALFFVASCLAVAGLIYSASQTAGSLIDRELGLRAEDLARYVSLDAAGKPRLDLPPDLKQAYDAAAQRSVFAIRDKDGRQLFPADRLRAPGTRLFRGQRAARQRRRPTLGDGCRGIGPTHSSR